MAKINRSKSGCHLVFISSPYRAYGRVARSRVTPDGAARVARRFSRDGCGQTPIGPIRERAIIGATGEV